jgi:hypothetical protein
MSEKPGFPEANRPGEFLALRTLLANSQAFFSLKQLKGVKGRPFENCKAAAKQKTLQFTIHD